MADRYLLYIDILGVSELLYKPTGRDARWSNMLWGFRLLPSLCKQL